MGKVKRVILITGASSGIGEACAHYLSERGYRVVGTSRKAAAPAPLESGPAPNFEMLQMDVDSDASVAQAIAHVVERAGRLDVLVNNAGIAIAGALEDTSVDEAKAVLETNLFGVWRLCQQALPVMRQQGGGYIINISSIAGVIGIPFQAAYSASKFALEGLSESLSAEVKPFGVHVVLVEPGDLPTALTMNRTKTRQSQKNPLYRERFERALAIMEQAEREGLLPLLVAQLLEQIINDPSSKLRYVVGPGVQRLAVALKRFLPGRLFERLLMRSYGIR